MGMASSRLRCDVGSFYIMLFFFFFLPRLFCFVSFLSVVSIFCDCGSFCLLLPLFVCVCFFVSFLPALSTDKTFHCDREINEADKRQQIFECQTSYTHKPVREKPRRDVSSLPNWDIH